ncbi:glycosyltransferase family 4 protein [Namhaeicola litoreus]|uniref:Glycosyltransferase family 4 protein n=1 Tax=Namhaeicola litoreus TaxID=1052145 RepID=A0ABW3Y1Q6_9FLAO
MQSRNGLKVFVDAYLLNKEPQGTVTYLKGLYAAVVRQNPEIDFYFGCMNQFKAEELDSLENVHYIYYKNPSRIKRMLHEIPHIIAHYKFDFAHFQYVIPLKKYEHCVYINTIHDVLFMDFPEYFPLNYRWVRRLLFKRSAIKCDVLLTVSEYSKRAIEQHFEIDKRKIKVISNGISAKFFEEYDSTNIKSEVKSEFGLEKYLLMVSRIEPRKNQALVLQTFFEQKWDESGFQLVFVGAKSIKYKQLEKMMTSLSTQQIKCVHFIAEIGDHALLKIYRGAEGFIYPSMAEGFGIPPLEAGSCAIPVLCSNNTAMEAYDFFKPYFCDVANENDFKKVFSIFTHSRSQKELEVIRTEIKKRYRWEESAEKFSIILLSNKK